MDSPGQEGRCLTCQRADFKLIKPHRRDDPGASSTALLKAMQAPHKRLLRKVNNSGGALPGTGILAWARAGARSGWEARSPAT